MPHAKTMTGDKMTDLTRRRIVAFPFAALGASVVHAPVWANDYPNRVVRLVVPFGPGGATDLVARVLAASQHRMGTRC